MWTNVRALPVKPHAANDTAWRNGLQTSERVPASDVFLAGNQEEASWERAFFIIIGEDPDSWLRIPNKADFTAELQERHGHREEFR